MSQENSSPDPKTKHLSFEKTRYDYSIKMFENEASRKQNLETKAQFYLTFVTAFLTAIFLSLPYLTILQGFMHNNRVDQNWRVAITAFILALGIGLLFSLISVLFAMKIQDYRAIYPLLPKPRHGWFDNNMIILRLVVKGFSSMKLNATVRVAKIGSARAIANTEIVPGMSNFPTEIKA
jgi:hypothetical protein